MRALCWLLDVYLPCEGWVGSMPMEGSFLLVHSPLVGPSSWAALAQRAAARAADVAVPDLTQAVVARPPRWKLLVETAVAATEDLNGPIMMIGHSGAGAYLPQIGQQLAGRVEALLFVDAVIPPEEGGYQTPGRLQDLLDEVTVDGMLLPWLDWWPADAVQELLPNSTDREVLRADMPRLPRSFYGEEVPVPDAWSDRPCGYIQLSAGYDTEFGEAANRGWPAVAIEGTHLSIYTEPERVLDAIDSLRKMLTA